MSAAKALLLVAGGMGLVAIDVSNTQSPQKLKRTSSGVATHKGGAHVALYGAQGEYAIVVGGMGLAVLSSERDEWTGGGGCCAVM